jgi:oxaloacetate decarboxylase (Na+ extruding) subunit alpha
MSNLVQLVDTTLRDGNQSLWGATGLTTPDAVGIAPTLDRVGYHAVDFMASTHMAVSVRYHHEDPWDRIRLVAAAMPETRLTFLTTGARFISWRPAGDDVIELVFAAVVRNGLRRVQIAEPSNDAAKLARLAVLAKRAGADEVVAALTYSQSPVHTDGYYAARLPALAAAEAIDRVYLKDPGGLLTPERVRALVGLIVSGAGGKPVEVHSHCTTGLAPLVYMDALGAGARVLHTAVRPLANGTSQPAADTTLRNARVEGFQAELDLEALAACTAWFEELAARKGLPTGAPLEYDAAHYRHQLPGGMVTTMRRQLEELRRPELFDAALAEVQQVRAELGYPIMVTPFSQFVGAQAVMNVLGGERYETVPDEVVRYMLGQFGDPPVPPDPRVADKVLALPRAAELDGVEPLSLDGARDRLGRRLSDEELLLRLTMPAEQVDAMKAGPPAPAPPAPGRGSAPVVRLLRELDERRAITYMRLSTEDETLLWRRERNDDARR